MAAVAIRGSMSKGQPKPLKSSESQHAPFLPYWPITATLAPKRLRSGAACPSHGPPTCCLCSPAPCTHLEAVDDHPAQAVAHLGARASQNLLRIGILQGAGNTRAQSEGAVGATGRCQQRSRPARGLEHQALSSPSLRSLLSAPVHCLLPRGHGQIPPAFAPHPLCAHVCLQPALCDALRQLAQHVPDRLQRTRHLPLQRGGARKQARPGLVRPAV